MERKRSHNLLVVVFLSVLAAGCYTTQTKKEEELVPLDEAALKQRQPLPLEQRKRVAVLEFEDRTDFGQGRLGRSAANVLTTYLDRSGQFALYERERLSKIMDEQKLSYGQGFDPSTAIAVGKTAGVEMVFIGTVSNFGYRSRRNQALFFGSHVQQEAEATVDVRIIDVATGRIIASESGRGITSVGTGQVLGVGTSAGYDQTICGNALRAAIVKFVDKLIDQSLDKR